MTTPPGRTVDGLTRLGVTPRERAVLLAVCQRRTNAEIASQLTISVRTVESHVAALLRKFAVHDRHSLIAASAGIDFAARGRPDPVRRAPMPVNTALLDRSGVIVAVNHAWNRFCIENGGTLSACGPGRSYLEVCDRAGDPDSVAVAGYIRTATRGGVFVPFRTSIPCDSPTEPHRYDLLVSSRVDDDGVCVGATVSLSEVLPVV